MTGSHRVETGVTITGTWSLNSTWCDGGFPIGGAFRHTTSSGTGTKKISFPLGAAAADEYRVYVKWSSATNRATNAKFTVHHDGGTSQTTGWPGAMAPPRGRID